MPAGSRRRRGSRAWSRRRRKLRDARADWPSQLNVVLGAYHVPAARHPDMPALLVLSAILSAGRSSRLYQALVRKGRMALFAGGFAQPRGASGSAW